MIRRLALALLASALFGAPRIGHAQESFVGQLPLPTGEYGIGRVKLLFVDSARSDRMGGSVGRPRELVVDVWYPTKRKTSYHKKTGKKFNVVPHGTYIEAAAFQGGSVTVLRNQFGRAFAAVKDRQVQSHARDWAAFHPDIQRAPLLLFSHSTGSMSQVYTTQIEALASRGYIVAAITHPYDAGLTVFPDGRRALFDSVAWDAAGTTDEEIVSFTRARIDWLAADVLTVLRGLININSLSLLALPFSGRLDLNRIGAFGHSIGGDAAARACQLDSRIKACSNQVGSLRYSPFELDKRGYGLSQPFLLIERGALPAVPFEGELVSNRKVQSKEELFQKRMQARQDSLLARTGGAYRIRLVANKTSDMSFSDVPMLKASSADEWKEHAQTLRAITEFTTAFFDKALKGKRTPGALDRVIGNVALESIWRFEPMKVVNR
jgi:hypothetical protein